MPGPLTAAHTVTKLPAQDLERARAWYRERLGLEPVEERPGGLRYRCGETEFHLFASGGRPSGESTQMGFEVDDLAAAVAELQARGVVFEDPGFADLETRGAIVVVPGNYPSKGAGELGAFLRDCEGNLIGLGQAT